MDHSIDKRWKIGEGFMHLENMFLVRLVSVSKGSFQPEIWVADTSMHTTHWDRPAAGPGTGTFPGDPMLSLGSRTEQSTSLIPVEMTIDIPLLSVAPVDDMSTMFRELISHDFNHLLNRTKGEGGRAF
ncbi:hypothetical protein BDM02DRAFT_3121808 [Thelephora ganbajun]|uniref:Uncharacterized protein n=1 Tax=Thelephora ganbajun TaxID=370292 RepID=A0ACB6Z4B3_THEGA|nr:hypothetical protein BDM02DRAFT_3121808 [Thelephora ganbajun]